MIAFTINHVRPWLMSGQLAGIDFMLVAQDGGHMETASYTGPATLPAREEPYTQADYEAKCLAIVEAEGMEKPLRDAILARQSRPVVAPSTPPILSDTEKRIFWMGHVDNAVEQILRRHTRFQMGYTEREAAARAYINSGYTIAPTVWVTRFADNVGMTYQAAASLILSQADKLRAALVQLEALRMDKYLIQAAATIAFAESEYRRIIAEVEAIGESLV